MDESLEKDKDLVQLSRLALSGRPQDVQTYVLRMSRKYQKTAPQLAEQLKHLFQQNPTRQSPLRSETLAAIPVDRDTRLQMLRHEQPGNLDIAPIWSKVVAESLSQIVSEHVHHSDLLEQGLFPTRTVILTGPPGVGKTLAARWLSEQLKRPLLTLDLSAVMSSFLGRTGANVRLVLDYAKDVSCVLLLDELDAIAKRRDDSHEVGELKRLVTVLLQEIDDWPEGGLLVAASNHPELLDPAVWRRFEMQIDMGLPDRPAVRQAIRMFLADSPELSDVWLTTLTELLHGESFSDIERELKTLRRQAALTRAPLDQFFPHLVRGRMEGLPMATKKDVAARLSVAGLSQRAINDLTGLSRDTIRKITPDDKIARNTEG